MGDIIAFHAASFVRGRGRKILRGHGPSGQLSENHCSVLSERRTPMSEPLAMAANFLPSLKARELTVESDMPSIAAYARATSKSCSVPTMSHISVILPVLSTVKSPNVKSVDSGHFTGMDLRRSLAVIEKRLKELGLSANKVSNECGHPDAIRNLRRAVRDGKGGFNTRTLTALAARLGISPERLIYDSPKKLADNPSFEELLAEREELFERLRGVQAAIERMANKPGKKNR